MATTAFVVSGLATAGSAISSYRAASAQNDAQKKEARAQRRTAELENVRQARRAVAAQRLQAAEIEQAAASEGVRSSSGVAGAVGSLQTQTASNIGAANTRLAGQVAANRALVTGARRARRFNTAGDVFAGIGAISQTTGEVLSIRDQNRRYREQMAQYGNPIG